MSKTLPPRPLEEPIVVAHYRLELGPVPLHHQVYLDLKSAIDAGQLVPGDRVPPERDLCRRYGCSLITVRRALSELAREGRIERTRGRGTFVLKPRIERDLTDALSFAEEMQRRGLTPETRLVAARPESATEITASALALEVGSPTLYLERLRLAEGEPLLLEQVHLSAERFPGLLASDLQRNSLYELLTDRYGAQIAKARESLEPVLLRVHEARLLEQSPRSPALLIEGTTFDDHDVPIEFARTYVRADRTRYYVERAVVRASQLPDRERPLAAGLRPLSRAGS